MNRSDVYLLKADIVTCAGYCGIVIRLVQEYEIENVKVLA